METLYKLGINDNDMKYILEQLPEILETKEQDIEEKIYLLEYIGCNERHIRNIIISNPLYLDRITSDIIKLINKLNNYGFTNLDLLFDSNPFLLNKDAFEIEEYINQRLSKNNSLEDIIDEFETNPYIIDEYY